MPALDYRRILLSALYLFEKPFIWQSNVNKQLKPYLGAKKENGLVLCDLFWDDFDGTGSSFKN